MRRCAAWVIGSAQSTLSNAPRSARHTLSGVAASARAAQHKTWGFLRRYREDSFVRTEANLAALQVGYALLIALLATGALIILYRDVTHDMTAAFVAILTSPTPPSPDAVQASLEGIRVRTVIELSTVLFATAALFSYLVTRFALAPAKNALSAQKRFIGDIAHELRTPLAVIRTNTEVRLLEHDVPKGAREMHLSNLEELDRISSLINNLLTLNALLRPEDIPFGAVDLGEVARRALDRFAGLAQRHNVRLALSAAKNHPALGNESALEQIVMNLVKNAIQHTAEGSVRVSVAPATAATIALTVADTGTGITSEDLAHILEPFYRGDRARSRSGGAGSGLGLAIVNELVRLHKGRIRIQSAPGAGTRVTVTVPALVRRAREPVARIPEVRADFSDAQA